MQFIICLINCLSISIRPDILTITNLLTKYMATQSKVYIKAATRVLCYLKGTQHHDISFCSDTNNTFEDFVKFPMNKIIGFTDTNWGPQDQSVPKLAAPLVILKF